MDHHIVSKLHSAATEWSYEEYSKKETGYTREYWMAYKLIELVVEECAMIAYQFDRENGQYTANQILYEFNVDNIRDEQ